jgi:hypothetical protein
MLGGRARFSMDGVAMATVNLRRSTFKARVYLFTKTWSKTGEHRITIEVLASGRPVAIDEFITRR